MKNQTEDMMDKPSGYKDFMCVPQTTRVSCRGSFCYRYMGVARE